MLKKLRAYLRISGAILALAFRLSGLLLRNALMGPSALRGFRYRTRYIKDAMAILGIELEVRGKVPDGHYLLVSNHRSLVDPVIVLRDIWAYVVSKAEVGDIPLLGKGAVATGVIYVKRDMKRSRAAALDAIRQGLTEGKNIMIFPEGTTSDSETTIEFKVGSFKVAAELNVPVIPVALDYEDQSDYWVSGSLSSHMIKIFSRRKTRAKVWIGEPITSVDPEFLMAASREWINAQIPLMRADFNKT